ncbi:MAG: efflux RND transporter periplasmic adaptor subunit [Bacteroidetes bacterium]|nr:efflux RND transporter periplasmic adaptor subunit [Bacteroidota bacterium]
MKNTILSIVISAILVACGSSDKKAKLEKLIKQKEDLETKIATLQEEIAKTDTTLKKGESIEIAVAQLSPTTFKTYIEIQGKVDADENVSLSSEIPGTVTKINVKVGEEVHKGQVLAETDTRVIQQQIADLQTNLDLATQVYQKQKNLWDQKIGTEIQFLQTKNNKESLENKLSALHEQARMSKIISPIDGTVDAVNIKIGQAIAPGLPAINVINFSNLKVKADVAEGYASRINTGNETIVYFPDMKDSVISKIKYSSRAINNITRTFGVEVLLDNTKQYHPNMVTKLKINDYQSKAPVIALPVKYIQKDDKGSFTLVNENGLAVKKYLTIGKEYNGLDEILGGLSTNDNLITEGYDIVTEGAKVSVKTK